MKEIIAATWKMHRKDLPGNCFPLGIQDPIERPTIMKSNSSVLYKWFSFYSLLSIPKTPPNRSCYCSMGLYSVRALQMRLKGSE